MSLERFRLIEELYHAARESSGAARVALLAEVDPEVRSEVESLLAQAASGAFLDRPAIENVPPVPEDPNATLLTTGVSFGPYRLGSRIGAGGMGEVFRAIDTRLGRAVAVKIAQERFIERFEREARAISSLNHPHICTIYDVGPNYLVMELVEGETIAARLKSGPFPVETALLYGSQILAALALAHEKGIVHRDLKPGNVMIAKSGVKVLDFGLAKSERDANITGTHMVMGTPAYMAPEQREGKPADARSDIYSFGCLLYEMLTGARVGVQRRRILSPKLEGIVSGCLEVNPEQRWQSAGELERELEGAMANRRHGKRDATTVAPLAAGNSYARQTVKQAAKSTVVLADFANATGDVEFDDALRQFLAAQLEISPGLSVLPDARARHALISMGLPSNAKLTPEMAAEICERTASAAVVEGSITGLGSKYLLSLRARDCRSGEILEQEQTSVARKHDVFKALTRIAKRFGGRAGESLPRTEKEPTLLTETTTPSLEAWRCYSAAMKALQGRGSTAAEVKSLLQRAIDFDPTFAIAHAYLGRHYDALGESESGARHIAKAYELREGVSDWENYFITFNYQRQVTRNLEMARQILESWAQKYPNDLYPIGFLAGFTTQGTGHYEQAAEWAVKAISLNRVYAIGYGNGAWAYLYSNRLVEAEALLREAAEYKVETDTFSLLRYFIAFLKRDEAAMVREVAQRQTNSRAQGWFEHQEALTLACRGRVREADSLSERAVNLARLGDFPERTALFVGTRAVWNALYGITAEARKNAGAALSLFRGRDADYGPAFALALLGDAAQAHAIEMEIGERYPQDTSVQFSYLPVLRGLRALKDGDPAKALEMAQAAASYEFGIPGTAFYAGAFFGALYPAYVRGLAYLQLNRHREAVVEFQKIVDHSGLVLNDPVGPMARLQLARAHAARGDRAKSAATYEDFLNVWKDADADVPVLKRANAEYAQLQ